MKRMAVLWAHRNRLLAAIAAAAVAAVITVVGLHHGLPAVQVALSPGTAWVASNSVGELTLIDGGAGEIAERVKVANDGGEIGAAQYGATGYALNRKDGTVVRIDGATLKPSHPVRLAETPGSSLRLYPTKTALYVVDESQGRISAADPETLGVRPTDLAAGAASGYAVSADALWIVDGRSGAITWTGNGSARHRDPVGPAGSVVLTMASGAPVVVDRTGGTARMLSADSADVLASMPVTLAAGDLVTGSPDRQRIDVVQPAKGAILPCSFARGTCQPPVYLGKGSARLGPAIEVADHALVPDYSNGSIWIVDLLQMVAVKNVALFQRPLVFDLFTRDGIVFYNDPNSEQAGTLDLDGRVHAIAKYDVNDPHRTPLPGSSPPRPTSSASHKTVASQHASPTRSARTGTSPSQRTDPGTSPTPPPPAPVRIQRLIVSPTTPKTDERVAFSASISGEPPTSWQWTVTAQPAGTVVATSLAAEFGQAFTTAGTYRVTLEVRSETNTDRKSADFRVVVPPPPVNCGDVITVSLTLDHDLNCSGDGLVIGADSITIDLGGHAVRGSGTGSGIFVDSARPADGATVRNGTIGGFSTDIILRAHSGLSFVNLKFGALIERTANGPGLRVQGGTANSISIRSGSRATITGVTARSIGFTDDGGNSIISNNTITGGLSFSESSLNTVSNNTFNNATVTVFIAGNTIVDNLFNGAASGVWIDSVPERVSIRTNRFMGSAIGVKVTVTNFGELTGLTISGNTFRNNGQAGIFIESNNADTPASSTVSISGNDIDRAGITGPALNDRNGSRINDGIHINVQSGVNLVVSNNHTTNNADLGIESTNPINDGGILNHASGNGDAAQCTGLVCAVP